MKSRNITESKSSGLRWKRSFGLSEVIMFVVGLGTGLLAMLFFG